jgi:chromosome segregation ATPase
MAAQATLEFHRSDSRLQLLCRICYLTLHLILQVKATMITCDAKLVEARAKLEALKKEKVEIERQLEANRQQVASANQNLEQLQKPEVIQVALKDAEAKMATQDKELAETGKQVAQATQLKNDCQQKFDKHIAAMEKLEEMQKDGKALCESWENKMRKHKTKAKKLIAQSSVFNTTVSEIQTRIGEESDQWTEVLKPLIAEAISELQNLHNQLDNK